MSTESYEKLTKLTEKELIARNDEVAYLHEPSINYYLDELRHRELRDFLTEIHRELKALRNKQG